MRETLEINFSKKSTNFWAFRATFPPPRPTHPMPAFGWGWRKGYFLWVPVTCSRLPRAGNAVATDGAIGVPLPFILRYKLYMAQGRECSFPVDTSSICWRSKILCTFPPGAARQTQSLRFSSSPFLALCHSLQQAQDKS